MHVNHWGGREELWSGAQSGGCFDFTKVVCATSDLHESVSPHRPRLHVSGLSESSQMAEGGDTSLTATKRGARGSDGAGSCSSAAPAGPPQVEQEAPVQENVEYSVEELLEQHQELIDSMMTEEILDEQFSQLQMLQDESTPDFVEEVVTLYFDDSDKLLENLTESLKTDPIDYKVVDEHVHQFKGSSASVGAIRIKKVCITFRPCCEKHDKQGCLDHLVKVKEEFIILRTKLRKMLELEKQIIAAGGQLPFTDY